MITAGFGNQGANLVKQGVDSNTASTVAGIDTGGNLLGAFVPGGRAVQAMVNPAFGGFTDAINQKILKSTGHDKIAEQYDPTSIERRLTDAVTGAVLPPNLRPKENTRKKTCSRTPKPDVPPFDELAFVQTAKEKHQQSLEQLYDLQSVLIERINNGDVSKEVVRALEDLDPQIEHHLKEIQRATDILEGKSSPDTAKQINKTHTQDVPENEHTQTHQTNTGDSRTVEVGGDDPHTIIYTRRDDGRIIRKIIYPDGTTSEEFLVHTKDGDEVWVNTDSYARGEYYPQQFTDTQFNNWLAIEHPNTSPPIPIKVSNRSRSK